MSPREKKFCAMVNSHSLYSTYSISSNIDEIDLNQKSIEFTSLADGHEEIKYKFIGVSGVYKLTNKNYPSRAEVNRVDTIYSKQTLNLNCKQISSHSSQCTSFILQLPDGEKRSIPRDFIEWFRGFTDGEGAFIIGRKADYYIFTFSITMHIDDACVLNFIYETLGIGTVFVYTKTNRAVFMVRAQEQIQVLIDIFTAHPLNTTKHLNFLAFTSAFKLYRAANVKKDVFLEVENIRANINSKRTNFEMPDTLIPKFTKYWFLGFTEGDGSFYVNKRYYQLGFSIDQKENRPFMGALANYLNNLGTIKGVQSFCNLYSEGNVCTLKITREDALHLVIIPLFDSVTWRSKKFTDYQDWKAILRIKQKFFHYTPKGRDLIERILAQMNNKRLSTSETPRVNRTFMLSDIADLLNQPINAELRDGKIWIKSDNRFLKRPSAYQKGLLGDS